MHTLDSLIERLDPLAPNASCGAVIDRFLDAPTCDLLPVVDGGRVLGIVARGAKNEDVTRAARDVMTPAFLVDADMSIAEARALWLTHRDPMAGFVVVREGAYAGVVSARALMRGPSTDAVMRTGQLTFLDLISREMRQPLNGLLAVSQLLQRQHLPADAHVHVRTMVEQAQATLRALDDALELSRVDSDVLCLEPETVHLRELMDGVQATWQQRASQCGVTLLVAYDGDPNLSATIDGSRVQEVFDKLIEAALSLSRRGALEAILQAERTDDGLRLTGRVRDTGDGLSAERLAGVFDFDGAGHADGLARAGLGLTLCASLVHRMGGTIRPEGNLGAGATVVFELPATEAAAEAAPQIGGLGRAAHVLVVDDNATNRMVAEALCDMFDCSSECAEDGIEAVEAARTGRFDLILMDIRMPRMDGVEATRAIRALPGALGDVPIIALTANADPEDAKTYLAAGIQSVVEKPIKPERLLQAMNQALPSPDADAAAA